MQLKDDVQKKLYLAGLILVANIILVLVARLTGCAPTDSPAPPPAQCGDLKLGQRKVEACQGGSKVTLCTESGVKVEADTCGLQSGACLSYEVDAKPVLDTFCVSCHRGELDSFGGARSRASELGRRIALSPSDPRHMPTQGARPLSEADQNTLEAWVETGAKQKCDPAGGGGGFKDLSYIESAMVNDALTQDQDDLENIAYLVSAHKADEGQDLGDVEKAINKGINSISTERQLLKPWQ
jgi:hypothetical protein